MSGAEREGAGERVKAIDDAHFTHIVRAPGQDTGNGSEIVCDIGESPRRKTLPDAAFIANAPDDIAFLLAALSQVEEERDALRGALKRVHDRTRYCSDNVSFDVDAIVRPALASSPDGGDT